MSVDAVHESTPRYPLFCILYVMLMMWRGSRGKYNFYFVFNSSGITQAAIATMEPCSRMKKRSERWGKNIASLLYLFYNTESRESKWRRQKKKEIFSDLSSFESQLPLRAITTIRPCLNLFHSRLLIPSDFFVVVFRTSEKSLWIVLVVVM
jgi:hypothetical protein